MMSPAEYSNSNLSGAAAIEDETEAVTPVEGTGQTVDDSTDQATPENEVQKSLAQLLGTFQKINTINLRCLNFAYLFFLFEIFVAKLLYKYLFSPSD